MYLICYAFQNSKKKLISIVWKLTNATPEAACCLPTATSEVSVDGTISHQLTERARRKLGGEAIFIRLRPVIEDDEMRPSALVGQND